MADWIKIKSEYLNSNISQRKLAEKCGVSFDTLKDRANREQWAQQRTQQHNKIAQMTQQKAVDRISNNQADLAVNIAELDKKGLKKAEKMLEKVTTPQEFKSWTSAYREIKENNRQTEDDGSPVYTGLPARVMGSEWVDVNRDIDERSHNQYDFKGGRGSLKSSFCAEKLVDMIMLNDNFCALAVKQHFNEIKDSVYAQIVWAIDELGLTDQFYCVKSPFEIKRKSTGQVIFFRAGEDPGKIKSIKPPNGMHIGIVWIEEADQIKGEDALRNILQSAFRGGDDGFLFRSYNTPISAQHYINVQERQDNPHRLIHHSHFKNAPKKWLGQRFYDEAEQLRLTNERAYRHEYDGEATGTGANIFENVTLREITDEELSHFDRLYYGLDWGFYPDPLHFAGCHFDPAQQKLYIFLELRLYKSGNDNTAKELADYQNVRITADSAEPKSVSDFRAWGFNMSGAIKGPGSREYSYKWLQGLGEIIIDPTRCPSTAEEFVSLEYERNKDNEIITGYPEINDHGVDAIRYALESIWKRKGQ